MRFIGLVLFFLSLNVFACENFNGLYYSPMNGEKIYFEQSGCDKIVFGNAYEKKEYVADGQWHIFYQSKRIQIERRVEFVDSVLFFDELTDRGTEFAFNQRTTYSKTNNGLNRNIKIFNNKGEVLMEDDLAFINASK